MDKLVEVETIKTPTVDVDELTGFPDGYKMIFQIRQFNVCAEVIEEGEETEYSVTIEGVYNAQKFLRDPNAEDAQKFLYKTILDGIFVLGDFVVVFKP